MSNFELSHLLNYNNESILDEIRRVAKKVKGISMTAAEFDRFARVASSTVRRRFGGWRSALEKAGVGHMYSGGVITQGMKKRCGKRNPKQDIISELIRVSEVLGRKTFTAKEYDGIASISASTVLRRFGSWAAGLTVAGLTPGRGARRYSEEDYFENLFGVWTFHGRQPYLREMDELPSIISAGAYEAKWGKWTNALRAFLQRMDQDLNEDDSHIPPDRENAAQVPVSMPVLGESSHRSAKQPIRLALRYQVLHRDRFRCTRCGASPATDITCKLHIDHIFPESKGGRTVLDNLRALCEKCNIGKGSNVENLN